MGSSSDHVGYRPLPPSTPLWQKALERYREELDESDDYQTIAEEGIKGGTLGHPEILETLIPRPHTTVQSATRLSAVLKTVDDFSAAVALCCGADPMVTGFVWGSIRLILTLASSAGETMQQVIDMLEDLSMTLPRFRSYEQTLDIDRAFEKALVDVYTEVICFYARVIHFFRRNPHVPLLKRAWPGMEGDFQRTIRRIKILSAVVESEAEMARMRSNKPKYESVLQVMETMEPANILRDHKQDACFMPR